MNVRTVYLLSPHRKTPEQIKARKYQNTKAWRAKNRERRNQIERESRQRRAARLTR